MLKFQKIEAKMYKLVIGIKSQSINTTLHTMSQTTLLQTKIGQFRTWLSSAGLDEKDHQISGMEFCLARETDNMTCGVESLLMRWVLGKPF